MAQKTKQAVTTLKIVNLPTSIANAIKANAYSKGNTLAEYLTEVHAPAPAKKGRHNANAETRSRS
jgi:hypothetical protein